MFGCLFVCKLLLAHQELSSQTWHMQVHLGALMVLIHIRHYGVIMLPSNKLK